MPSTVRKVSYIKPPKKLEGGEGRRKKKSSFKVTQLKVTELDWNADFKIPTFQSTQTLQHFKTNNYLRVPGVSPRAPHLPGTQYCICLLTRGNGFDNAIYFFINTRGSGLTGVPHLFGKPQVHETNAGAPTAAGHFSLETGARSSSKFGTQNVHAVIQFITKGI